MHDHGIVHRDMKLDNVLMEEEGLKPIICDLGISKDRSSLLDPTTGDTATATSTILISPTSTNKSSEGRYRDPRSTQRYSFFSTSLIRTLQANPSSLYPRLLFPTAESVRHMNNACIVFLLRRIERRIPLFLCALNGAFQK